MTHQTCDILLCRCANSHVFPAAAAEEAIAALAARRLAVETVDDLCGLAARRDRRLAAFARAAPGPRIVVACFPRAVRWLFHAAGARLPKSAMLLNLRTQTAATVVANVTETAPGNRPARVGDRGAGGADQDAASQSAMRNPQSAIPPDSWTPWFPVIDYGRCTACKQCLNFCLFGVYTTQGKMVRVANPANCKTNCPACARVCPSAAIIFPKYHAAPINGEQVRPEDLARQGMKAGGLADLVDGNSLDALRQRARHLGGQAPQDAGKAILSLPTLGSLPARAQAILQAAKDRIQQTPASSQEDTGTVPSPSQQEERGTVPFSETTQKGGRPRARKGNRPRTQKGDSPQTTDNTQ